MLKTTGFPATRTGDQTIVDGSLVIDTAGEGIDFSANTPAAGMTSQLLNWYEEGTWTLTDASGAGLTFTFSYCQYVRVGKQVTVNVYIIFPATVSTANAAFGGLPFTVAANNYPPLTIGSSSGVALSCYANGLTTTLSVGSASNTSTPVTNATLSGANLILSGTYFI